MNQYKKVAFYTLGCKLNFSETSGIAQNFEKGGFARVDFEENPDVFVINTCSVTDNADKKCRNIVRRAKKINPNAYVAVIGCYAQLKPKEISTIEGVNLVLGANEKFNILEHVEQLEQDQSLEAVVMDGDINEVNEFFPSYSIGDRTRTFLKVQDGCDYSCSFCTIPLARGKSRSNTISETIDVAKRVAQTSAKEIVLTGVNLGDFGKNNNESFHGLVKQLDLLDGIERFRISSIEPNLLTDEIIETVAHGKKFVPHFHIPLQSGSPELLKAMRRRYKRDVYTSRVQKIKGLMPHCAIGVDVIVGFPGETEERFLETYNYLNELDVSYFHVFTYSERDNTVAPHLENAVDKKTRDDRSKKLRILSAKKKRAFYEENLGKTFPVLFEAENNNDVMYGFTENYIKVKTTFNDSLINEIKTVTLKEIDRDGLFLITFD
ncbi:MAG: tRNA (N(6)-L-threonylcarbamoyladenosine(37)-C(2))-methylthiotransferase MtaB [Flavobacteriales bacterium]|nr:tRNA (N(6)-L-threonylcarbamoyladenosine(37)-C(2))-methylthiotransferase MtaB [Flavobacteriales bacterium]|tara:strand:- start:2979 stop:4283 length:1305 start_codon:yes stop_codon:yes gene_type:complete